MGRATASLKLRQNATKPRKEMKTKDTKRGSKLQTKPPETSRSPLLFPAGDTAFKAILSARFCAAIWSHITDCDETFNYWEPMHFLIFGKGLQTWEYSPQFALRSYTYILFHAVPALIYHKLFQPNPLLIFYFTRCLLGLLAAFFEVYFYKAVCREFGIHIGRLCLAFLLFSPGMFISSTAFLPSSFAMYMFMGACSAWWGRNYNLAVFFTALGSLLGWPFAALLGVPIAYDMLVRQKLYKDFVMWSSISATVILLPMTIIDSMYYGKLVIAPLNIVKYNVLGGAGPELYGTEPFTFYIINGFLNFNFVWILALLSPFAISAYYLFVPTKQPTTFILPYWISLSPILLWMVVFMFQPHKEERFLFPIYPMICLCGAITLDVIQKLAFRVWTIFNTMPPGTHYLDKTMFIMYFTIIVTSLLGISRICALYRYYHAPMDLLMEVNKYPLDFKVPEKTNINVCIGKDWHRFPNSFFLPNTQWDIRFIKSEFDGMLPAPYATTENATSIVHDHFNDKNLENPNVYININKCHFLLDLDLGKETVLEPNYGSMTNRWKIITSYSFLNSEKSNKFFRAFFIPYLSSNYIEFGNFSLLRTKYIWK
ncbi:alpha-1,2-mannosyltransferase ALG9 [Coccinella septempunctata]|uniref:alpha-1,2-mannosyltransferase ALG9 n=1 Tax=Coccinella septempunctata TaxID=41139 RepID=UPI001D07CC6C|nr:alpha-1,2-mannosyltransferase ALG9 [Coccinella septempunctata]